MIVRQGSRYLIEGPITLENVSKLIDEGSVFEGESVIVDLAGITTVDSSALSLLLEWMRHSAKGGQQIAFANMPRSLRSLAELYGVIDLIPVSAG